MEEGFECISDILRLNCTLKELNAGSNIGIATAQQSSKAIYEGLKKNKTLISLDLSVSFLGEEEGCRWISEGISINSTLKSLNLDKNYLKGGLRYLVDSLKVNNSLTELVLTKNSIDGIYTIIKIMGQF
jgi:hypothetical protein